MNENVGQQQSTMLNITKLIISILVLLAGIVSYYYFVQTAIFLRILMILASIPVALIVFYQTIQGKRLWDFFQGSRVEIRKVIWPTRQETIQTTLTVFVFILVLGIFFWLLDFLLLFITTSVTS